jgi:hypothetical protein
VEFAATVLSACTPVALSFSCAVRPQGAGPKIGQACGTKSTNGGGQKIGGSGHDRHFAVESLLRERIVFLYGFVGVYTSATKNQELAENFFSIFAMAKIGRFGHLQNVKEHVHLHAR